MRYGFDFKLGVYNSLKLLTEEEERGYTVSEVLAHYIEAQKLNPAKKYKLTLYSRVWQFLTKEVQDERCSVEQKRHPSRHVFIGYYKKID